MPGLIDTHCHLESFHRRGILLPVLAQAQQAGVEKLITVGTGSKDWALYSRLAKEHPGVVYWTVGLHPCNVEEDWKEQVAEISTWFTTDPLPVALGEIGVDYFHLPKDGAEREMV